MSTKDFRKLKLVYTDKVFYFVPFQKGILLSIEASRHKLIFVKNFSNMPIEGRFSLHNSQIVFDLGVYFTSRNERDESEGMLLTNNLQLIKIPTPSYRLLKEDKGYYRLAKDLICKQIFEDTEIWKTSLDELGINKASMFNYNIKMQLVGENIVCLLKEGGVIAFNAANGKLMWQFGPENDEMQAAIISDGEKLYSVGYYLYELNPRNGEIVRRMPFLEQLEQKGFNGMCSPMRVYGKYGIVWHSFEKHIIIINLEKFEIEKMLKIRIGEENVGIPIMFDNIIIYENELFCILDTNKKLFVFEMEETESLVEEIIISREDYGKENFLGLGQSILFE